MSAPVIFMDIAGPNAEALRTFYQKLFEWESDAGGQLSLEVQRPLLAAIREDPAEKRVYIGVDDVTSKLLEIEEQGGSVDVPRFEVPGLVVLGLFRDPAGNPMGLVELEEGRIKVPEKGEG